MNKNRINKVLIANRGEIAVRIIRSVKELGIPTVAVYSDADRKSLHVQLADEAVYIGASVAAQSYLLHDVIIEACLKTNANAIHPGYGFLSENASFAQKVKENDIIFIGPSPQSIDVMGDKLKAKALAKSNNIPLVPGTDKPIDNIDEATTIAKKIGFPILIKASAGGGGKGMRIVNKESEFQESMDRAMSEAKSAFGDGSVFIEKFIESPRHIEFQILADQHGNIVHLFERECSIQRRYQKVIEEAPSCYLTDELRMEMGDCAVSIARACNYEGVGTVEFIMDHNKNYYFLEMNTRLQVEHPVTEMIVGKDLVIEQINVANGEILSFKQSDLQINGHSIELRVYAEDPDNSFLPDTGLIQDYQLPGGHGVRVDHGTTEGSEISVYYDPMISKLVTHAETRLLAIKKMYRAINEYRINGVITTLPFGAFVMKNEAFISGDFDTNFIPNHYKPKISKPSQEESEGILLITKELMAPNPKIRSNNTESKSNWKTRKRVS